MLPPSARSSPPNPASTSFSRSKTSAPPRAWTGSAQGLEELTIQYLSDSGEQVFSHAGRAGEFERYGLPATAKLSRATMLRIAQDLDADYVIYGTFTSDGTSLTVDSRVLRVDPPALLTPVHQTAPLASLMELQTGVVWHLVSANQRTYPLALKDFAKAQRPLRLDAFEHFVRGVLANEDEPRLRELREAARLEPTWPDPAFALGETYASHNDCNSALPGSPTSPRRTSITWKPHSPSESAACNSVSPTKPKRPSQPCKTLCAIARNTDPALTSRRAPIRPKSLTI